VAIQGKSNEIPTLQPLLRSLPSLESTLITADAMHRQQESARFITQELGGDYLFGLEGNQSGVLERTQRLLAQQAFAPGSRTARTIGAWRPVWLDWQGPVAPLNRHAAPPDELPPPSQTALPHFSFCKMKCTYCHFFVDEVAHCCLR
jgi:hypothetical protein